MKNTKSLSFFLKTLVAYFSLNISLIPFYLHKLNPDGISYISIARKYCSGNVHDAINGVWSPLLSWLLIPFIWMDCNPLLGIKFISLLTGLLTLFGLYYLIKTFEISPEAEKYACVGFVILNVYYSLYVITPDHLTVCFLVWYLLVIFNHQYTEKITGGLLCGFFGALSFLTKAFNFYFFLIHFLTLNVLIFFIHREKEKRKRIVANCILGFFFFALISSGWIYLLSEKYDALTISTAGAYNFSLISPHSSGKPVEHIGLMPPTDSTGISIWDDPASLFSITWNPLKSREECVLYLRIILKNIAKFASVFSPTDNIFFVILYALLLVGITMGALFLLLKRSNHIICVFALITIFYYSAGYCLTMLVERYLRIVYILYFILGYAVLTAFFKGQFWSRKPAVQIFNPRTQSCLLIIYLILFTSIPTYKIFHKFNKHKALYTLSNSLKRDYHIEGNFASDSEWNTTLYLTYHLNGKYFGIPQGENVYEQLKKNNIDYFFIWDEKNEASFSPAGLPTIHIIEGKYEFTLVALHDNRRMETARDSSRF